MGPSLGRLWMISAAFLNLASDMVVGELKVVVVGNAGR